MNSLEEAEVVSLPMRDGNRVHMERVVLRNLVVSLPMRDGNHVEHYFFSVTIKCC